MKAAAGSKRERTALGAMIMAGARAITKSIDLITLIVLARLLVKEDFGLVATALVFVQVAEAIFDIPVVVVLLRLKSVTRRHLDNLFTLGLLRGVFLSSVLCLLSFPLSVFYGDERLVALICVLSIAPAMRGLRSPRQALLARRLNFLPESAAEASGKVAALIIAVSLALTTGSYWAIAAGTVATPVVAAIVSFMLLPFRPKFNLHYWPLFRSFMGWSMASQAVAAFNWQSDRMTLGKFATLGNLGLFSITKDLAVNTIIAVVTTLTVPVNSALASVSSDRQRLSASYSLALGAIFTIAIPLAVGQALVADALIPLLLGESWTDAVPIFRIICAALVPAFFVHPTGALFLAVGRPDQVFTRNVIDFCYRIPITIALTVQYGIYGAACALLISDSLMAIVCAFSSRRLTGLSVFRQFRSAFRPLASCVFMAATIELVRLLTGPPGETLGEFWFLAITVLAGGLTYVAAHLLLWRLAGKPEGIESLVLGFAWRKLEAWKANRANQAMI